MSMLRQDRFVRISPMSTGWVTAVASSTEAIFQNFQNFLAIHRHHGVHKVCPDYVFLAKTLFGQISRSRNSGADIRHRMCVLRKLLGRHHSGQRLRRPIHDGPGERLSQRRQIFPQRTRRMVGSERRNQRGHVPRRARGEGQRRYRPGVFQIRVPGKGLTFSI